MATAPFRAAVTLAAIMASAPDAGAQDRHAGYYYPAPTTSETYESQATTLGEASRTRRVGFVTLLTAKNLAASYAPPYIMFAKGAEAEKLIVIGMGGYVANLYQARALLAQLTAQARAAPIFQEVEGGDMLNFLDLARMLGFEQVTVSNGTSFTLQILIK